MKKQPHKKLSKTEREYLFGLLKTLQTEFESDKAVGIKVDKKEEKLLSSLSQKFENYYSAGIY